MFLSNKDIKDKIKSIIVDDNDNDIIFVVGNRGVGKTQLLDELTKEIADSKETIVADGKQISSNTSNLAKCFIDGIKKYVERNNSKSTKWKLCEEIGKSNISITQKLKFVLNNCETTNYAPLWNNLAYLSLSKLKNIYYRIAGGTPLVIVSNTMVLSEIEVNYLCNLSSDTLGVNGARVTFVLGIRTNSKSVHQIKSVIDSMEKRTWILPLLPEIIEPGVIESPKLIAEVSLYNFGKIDSVEAFRDKLLLYDVYTEMFSIVRQITGKELSPCFLFLLANQEISFLGNDDLIVITEKILGKSAESCDERMILPKDGRFLWLDVLSYYYALLLQIDEAMIQIQKFFFALITKILEKNTICYRKDVINSFFSFVKYASIKKNNQLAQLFSNYYSDFATMVNVLSSHKVYKYNILEDTLASIQILDRVTIDFSGDNIQALSLIYENTQLCSLIDIGLETIYAYVASLDPESRISSNNKEIISSFLYFSMSVAYKWSDVTIVNEILNLEQVLISRGEKIRFCYHEPNSETSLLNYFLDRLNEQNISLGDINMKGTIFLSYTHANRIIADAFDTQLQSMAYDVMDSLFSKRPKENRVFDQRDGR